jgi:hypothetical protein
MMPLITPTVIDPRNFLDLVWQQRPKPLELLFAQLEPAQIHASGVAEPVSHSRRRRDALAFPDPAKAPDDAVSRSVLLYL